MNIVAYEANWYQEQQDIDVRLEEDALDLVLPGEGFLWCQVLEEGSVLLVGWIAIILSSFRGTGERVRRCDSPGASAPQRDISKFGRGMVIVVGGGAIS